MIYESTGAIRVGGCAIKRINKKFETYFAVGSKAWIKQKAKIGKLESVFIKKVYRTVPENYHYEGIAPAITYVDTFNRVWIEDELTWEDRATDYAKIYWQRTKKSNEDYFSNNCLPEPPCGT